MKNLSLLPGFERVTLFWVPRSNCCDDIDTHTVGQPPTTSFENFPDADFPLPIVLDECIGE